MGKRIDDLGAGGPSGRDDSGNSKRNSNSGVYSELTFRLRMLSFQAFRTLVFLWLSAKGYRQVQVLKRSASRGRRPTGGPDFLAISPYSPRTRVAIQIRHWQTPVQKRVVDEMRGWMLRLGVRQGLIVTRSSFFPGARRAARELEGKPIVLWPAPRLAGSVAALGLGIERVGNRFEIAEWFFRGMNQIQLGYSFKDRSSRAHFAKQIMPTQLGSVVGPGFGENWPDCLWQIVLILLVALLVAALVGGAR
ncbi:MAG: restriction endonuclease [Armatimonadetes bacterium]|nr:restriction endonuclease [Armatimonadota bacterium]